MGTVLGTGTIISWSKMAPTRLLLFVLRADPEEHTYKPVLGLYPCLQMASIIPFPFVLGLIPPVMDLLPSHVTR
ncbi:hypothetical protein JMJ77_0004204 [Colletotrichum scovillei]|uniref:Uncharacterized protein n=1 Tax=Colletotrichum scovillei TaxID=1209932 RepID=A0A9P7UE45_9PEZI|nr:hypothetical protein JMJ77_0004204 [Colletotrichum scovillei]KAG7049452.1 hypothetical protein JMJ78_0013435 [Colletotrichum scovillei]KAG7064195.1 hypothetical protein JMJ76_0007243 [Colletotrichum scovillei]